MNHPRHKGKESSGEDSSLTVQQAGLMAVIFLALALTLQAQPAWWTATGGPVNPAATTNDYAAANQGQLKQFTEKAALYMDIWLPGAAGGTVTNLDSVVAGWSNYYATNGYSATNPAPQDFNVVNQGQLKYIGNTVWANLVAAGYTNAIPTWLTGTNANDYKIVNLGQLKSVFNFDLTDSDTNGLYDWWEMQYFGHLGNDPNSSPDGNGYTLAQDYASGSNPTNYYSQGGTNIVPTIAIYSGNNQTNAPGGFTEDPLVVSVVNSVGGAPLTNAPVTFAATAGDGGVGANWGGFATTSQTVTTAAAGHAQVYYYSGTNFGVNSTITATTAGHSVTFHSATSPGDGTFDSPSDMTMTPASPSEIDLTWVNHATSATSIIIEKSTDDITWTTVVTLSDPAATSYAVTGLTVGQSYYFRIAGQR